MSHRPSVTARIVGGATLATSPGGKGPIVTDPEKAAEVLLANGPVHIPGALIFLRRVRRVMAEKALQGDGPDGTGANWQDQPERTTR